MGYYTNFEIRALEDPNEAFDAFLEDLADEADMDEIAYGYTSSVKWYDFDKDALKVSLKIRTFIRNRGRRRRIR